MVTNLDKPKFFVPNTIWITSYLQFNMSLILNGFLNSDVDNQILLLEKVDLSKARPYLITDSDFCDKYSRLQRVGYG